MHKVSAYVLTFNSEKYLHQVLSALCAMADDVLVLDSGSTDHTHDIVRQFPGVRLEVHPFTSFREQRIKAEQLCSYDMVLFLDSDEVPDEAFVDSFLQIKQEGFEKDAYNITRRWNVLGRQVHCVYPVLSPDDPVRVYNKTIASFQDSPHLHEAPRGFRTLGRVGGEVLHITFETPGELARKVEFYSDIAALDIVSQRKPAGFIPALVFPLLTWVKWYLVKGGYQDGRVGWVLSVFAFRIVRKKYLKARKLSSARA